MNWLRLLVAAFLTIWLASGASYGADRHAPPNVGDQHASVEAERATRSVSLEQIFFGVGVFVLLVLVAVLAIAYCLQAQESQQQSTHGQGAADWRERVLDATTEFNVWNAVAQGDGDALREELKLMELRAIRRQGQR